MSEQDEFGLYGICTESLLDGWTVGQRYGITEYMDIDNKHDVWLRVQDNAGDIVAITHSHNVKFNILWDEM